MNDDEKELRQDLNRMAMIGFGAGVLFTLSLIVIAYFTFDAQIIYYD